jgi:hypothetical protein
MAQFDIMLRTESGLHPDVKPEEFITKHTGVIRYRGEDNVVRGVGQVRAFRIHTDLATNSGASLCDICSAHSPEMHRIFSLLYRPDKDDFRYAIRKRFDLMDFDYLVLEHVLLSPRWRGLRLGLLAARKVIDLLGGGCGLVVARIAPLQHGRLRVPTSWFPRHATQEDVRQAAVKLRRYYRQMGFKRIGRSPYYGLAMAHRTPTLGDLLKPNLGA